MSVSLPDPSFIDRDPAAVEAAIVADYEAATGRRLYPAQLERLLAHVFAYRESLAREAFQLAAKQNLLAFATYPILDYMGDMVGAERIVAQVATGSVTLVADDPPPEGVIVLLGFRVSPPGGKVVFELTESCVLTETAPSATVSCRAVTGGALGNGFLAGSEWEFVDGLPYLSSVTCAAATAGGVDEEDDDRLRERIRLAPQAWATAGTKVAYRWHAMSVSVQILDAYVASWADDAAIPEGTVRVYLLTDPQLLGTTVGDAQAEQLRLLVDDYLNSEAIKALCDTISTQPVALVDVDGSVAVHYYANVDQGALAVALQAAFTVFRDGLLHKLGKDLVASQLEGVLQAVEGVYSVTVTFTGGAPPVITKNSVYRLNAFAWTYTQVAEEL